MKKHFILTYIALIYFGFGVGVEHFGIQAGLGLASCIFIFSTSVIFFTIIGTTSMNKIKKELFKKEEPKP